MGTLRNLPEGRPEKLSERIEIRPGRVVSMALSRSEACQITLLAFGAGESVSEEEYFGDTLYTVLEGEMPLQLGGCSHILRKDESICIPAHTLHAIGGAGSFKLLQVTLNV